MVKATLSSHDELCDLQASHIFELNLPNSQVCRQPIYLVCTNGQRDICCGQFGMPLYRELRAHYGDRIWQCSHIGGHRFAPNLLCLPSGLVYGFVTPEQSRDFVANADNNVLALDQLRGRSCLPAAAQAAEFFIRKELDQTNDCELRINSSELEQDRTIINLTIDGKDFDIGLTQSTWEHHVPASCGAEDKPVTEYSLDFVRPTL